MQDEALPEPGGSEADECTQSVTTTSLCTPHFHLLIFPALKFLDTLYHVFLA